MIGQGKIVSTVWYFYSASKPFSTDKLILRCVSGFNKTSYPPTNKKVKMKLEMFV